MTSFAVASCHGAPGVTTTVIGLAATWPGPERPVVVEADPAGGVLAARFDELRADRTLAEVAVDVRRRYDHDRVVASARALWGAIPVVVAPPSAEQTHGALAMAGEHLGEGAAGHGRAVVFDVGRLTARSPALAVARRSAMTVLMARPSFEAVATLAARAGELRSAGCTLGLVVVGERPYPPEEAAHEAGITLLGVLPDDAPSAAILAGGAGSSRRLRRSLLWRSLADLAARLDTMAADADAAACGAGGDEELATTRLAMPAPASPTGDVGAEANGSAAVSR
ncbi:MAG: hypothetical protein ACR2MO_02030 [Acidimicrobiales bacterium]